MWNRPCSNTTICILQEAAEHVHFFFNLLIYPLLFFPEFLFRWLFAGHTIIWLESFRRNQDMSTPTREAERAIKMTWRTSFSHFTDNLKALSWAYKGISWIVLQQNVIMNSMGRHKVKVKHFDSLLVKMNSHVKAEVDIIFCLFPSAISKGTVIHCVISYV